MLVYKALDECLYAQSGLGMVARDIRVTALGCPPGSTDPDKWTTPIVAGKDSMAHEATPGSGAGEESSGAESGGRSGSSVGKSQWWVELELRGEPFELGRHPQGTEVKAITFAQMTIAPPTSHCRDDPSDALTPCHDASKSNWHMFIVLDI